VRRAWDRPFFNEFAVELPLDAGRVCRRLLARGIAPGIPLGRYYRGGERWLLVAATEQRTPDDIRLLAGALAEEVEAAGA